MNLLTGLLSVPVFQLVSRTKDIWCQHAVLEAIFRNCLGHLHVSGRIWTMLRMPNRLRRTHQLNPTLRHQGNASGSDPDPGWHDFPFTGGWIEVTKRLYVQPGDFYPNMTSMTWTSGSGRNSVLRTVELRADQTSVFVFGQVWKFFAPISSFMAIRFWTADWIQTNQINKTQLNQSLRIRQNPAIGLSEIKYFFPYQVFQRSPFQTWSFPTRLSWKLLQIGFHFMYKLRNHS